MVKIEMKYTIYEMINGRIKVRFYSKSDNESTKNAPDCTPIAYANTVKEAKKIIKDLGEFELID